MSEESPVCCECGVIMACTQDDADHIAFQCPQCGMTLHIEMVDVEAEYLLACSCFGMARAVTGIPLRWRKPQMYRELRGIR